MFNKPIKNSLVYKQYRAWRKRKNRPDYPNILMIQTASMCNLKCLSCPYPILSKRGQIQAGVMAESLFDKILEECRTLPLSRISPYWNNEPFLDPKFKTRLFKLREVAGEKTEVHVSTNGSRLFEDIWEQTANCLDRMHLSAQGGIVNREKLIEGMPSIDYDAYYKNVVGFLNFLKKGNFRLQTKDVIINNVLPFESDAAMDKEIAFWKPFGVRLNFGGFNSYSGMVNMDQESSNQPKSKRIFGCSDKDRPIQAMHVLLNGDCVICCNDWVREIVVGNVNESSLKEIWNSNTYKHHVKLIYSGKENPEHMCANCDLAIR